ncbi:MAG: adenosylcobinamide-GDP ribazoletransferase [Desulfovibrionaceae bacterium]
MPLKPSGFLAALAFLTRLAPGRRLDDAAVGSAMPYLPLVGLVLGALCVGPLWLGVLRSFPLVQAWLAVVLLIWLTRGLHLDGVADICDGVAAHLDRERFWEIIKDSRVGAFGVLGLVLAVSGQIIFLGELFSAGLFGSALFAPVAGRCCAVVLGHAHRGRTRPGLGSLFLAGATRGALAFAVLTTLAAGLALAWLGDGPGQEAGSGMGHALGQLAGAVIGAAHFQFPLHALARRVGALNGDFLGCSIVAGECGAMLGMLVAAS